MASAEPVAEQGNGSAVVDKTAEYFGFVIAYLLPGLLGLWAASYYSERVRNWMVEAATHSTSLGGFLFLMVAAVGVGMGLHTLRWVVYEKGLPKVCRPAFCEQWWLNRPAYNEAKAKDSGIQAALANIRDQHYRYYQCHGGLSIATLLVYVAWAWKWHAHLSMTHLAVIGLAAFAFAVANFFAALDAQRRVRQKRFALLGGKREI